MKAIAFAAFSALLLGIAIAIVYGVVMIYAGYP